MNELIFALLINLVNSFVWDKAAPLPRDQAEALDPTNG